MQDLCWFHLCPNPPTTALEVNVAVPYPYDRRATIRVCDECRRKFLTVVCTQPDFKESHHG